MKMQKEIADLGLTEEMLLFFHSRTANAGMEIESAAIDAYWLRSTAPGDPLKIRITFAQGGMAEYTIDVAKTRQKRLNLLLSK